jgi:hypothetical protein
MGTSVAEWITAAGTAGAALAAAYAAQKASKSTAASVDLMRIERERLDEERRLREVAELRIDSKMMKNMEWRISAVNEGPAAARDVLMFVHEPGDPTTRYRRLKSSLDFPEILDRLPPHEAIDMETEARGGDMPNVGVVLEWSDSRGRQRRELISR